MKSRKKKNSIIYKERLRTSTVLFIFRVSYKFSYGIIMKEEHNMITFAIILITLLALAIAAALVILAGGAGVILAFGDLIICGGIIWLLVKLFRRRR